MTASLSPSDGTPQRDAPDPLPATAAAAAAPASAEGDVPAFTLRLCPEPFEPLQSLADWQQRLALGPAGPPAAESHFLGRVRGVGGDGKPLQALELEHYPGMSEAQLERLALDCARRHGVLAVLVLHRVGRILPGEAIVLVAVAADRRGPAQRCVQELLEALKHEAPFWKREWSGDRGTWVQGNTAF